MPDLQILKGIREDLIKSQQIVELNWNFSAAEKLVAFYHSKNVLASPENYLPLIFLTGTKITFAKADQK